MSQQLSPYSLQSNQLQFIQLLTVLPSIQTELQEKLCSLFSFTSEDLLWNRQGMLSPAQRATFERAEAHFRRQWSFWFTRLGIVLLAVLGCTLLIMNGSMYTILSAILDVMLALPPVLSTFLAFLIPVLMVACVVFVASLLAIPTQGRNMTAKELEAGVVCTVEGIVALSTGGEDRYYYAIANLSFLVQEGQYQTHLNNLPCRISYLPARVLIRPACILSIELLGS